MQAALELPGGQNNFFMSSSAVCSGGVQEQHSVAGSHASASSSHFFKGPV